MRQWVVAGGLIEMDGNVLLVQNRRRDGSLDWSTPGGVIEVHEGETVVDGLTREVAEETGIVVTGWEGPVYHVEAEAPGLGWHLRAEVYRAVEFSGELQIDDPDRIVVDARFVPLAECASCLDGNHIWVREPLGAWLTERWAEPRAYRYRVEGDRTLGITVVRL